MIIKPGARVFGIRPEMVLVLPIAEGIWKSHGVELVVTCIMDGTHSRASKHYSGCAVDLRTHGLPDAKAAVAKLSQALGADYDAILEGEGTPNEHCHVEFDPKSPY